jgi:hypothetical protein
LKEQSMKNATTKKVGFGAIGAVMALGAALAAFMPSVAHADPRGHDGGRQDWHHDDGDWHRHEAYARRYRGYPGQQPYVYAPPVVYSPPPPSGINLIVPFNFN